MKGIYTMILLCLFAISLVCTGAMASVNCQSMVAGDSISASTDYEQNIEDMNTCARIQSVYSSRLNSKGGDYQSIVSGSNTGLEQATTANIVGTYWDSMATLQATGVCEEGCENCGEEALPLTYVKAQFATSSMGSGMSVQTAGSSGMNAISGQAYITGTGTAQVTASAIDMTTTSSESFRQKIQSSGTGVTAGMIFDWAR